MDKLLNPSTEDIETNKILHQIMGYELMIPYKKYSLEQKYNEHLETQKRHYNSYIKVKGKPP